MLQDLVLVSLAYGSINPFRTAFKCESLTKLSRRVHKRNQVLICRPSKRRSNMFAYFETTQFSVLSSDTRYFP